MSRECAALLRLMPEPAMLVDGRGVIREVNPALAHLLSCPARELRGRLLRDLASDPAEELASALRSCARSADPTVGRLNLHKPGGGELAFPYRGLALRPARADVPALLALQLETNAALRVLSHDQESREQQRRLRSQSEQELHLLRTAVEQTAEAIMVTDAAGRIRYTNSAFERITGYDKSKVQGENPRLLKSGRQDTAYYEDLWQTILRGEDWSGQLINRRRDGSEYLAELTISPVRSPAGRMTHFVAVSRDVSEATRNAEELRQGQKLESLGRLAGGLAHDFNNLLTVISGHCELIEGSLLDGDSLRDDVEAISQAAERAAAMTKRLLAFSRRNPVDSKVLELNALILGEVEMLSRLIEDDVKLTTALSPDIGRIEADPVEIEQVLMNLVVNSRDAMPEGGEISIETADVEVDGAFCAGHPGFEPGRFVRLVIQDAGSGMSAEVLSRAFDPFFTTKGPDEGTGLGLSAALGIVERSGGRILVQSAVDEGTRVDIYFPVVATRKEEALLSARSTPADPGESATILVVEDEEAIRRLIVRSLEAHGHTVLQARDGREAIALSERGIAVDLVVSDVMMPGASGEQVAQAFCQMDAPPKLILMSGWTEDLNTQQDAMHPVRHFLPKPFSMRELAAKVREVLDSCEG